MSIDFLAQSQNLPFSICLILLLFFFTLELVGALFGIGLSGLADSVSPDVDVDVDADLDADLEGLDTLGTILAWLRVGEVPVIVILILFFLGFSLSGLAIQLTTTNLFGFLWPSYFAAIPAFFATMPFIRVTAGVVGKLVPKDETSAISVASFSGRVGTIVLGQARKGSPVQAKFTDEHGQTHYLLVEPDGANDVLNQSDHILIVEQVGKTGTFKAIKAPDHLIS